MKNMNKNTKEVKFYNSNSYNIEATLETLMKVAEHVKSMVNPGDSKDDIINKFTHIVSDVLFPYENYDGGVFTIDGIEYDGTISLFFDLFGDEITDQAIDYVMNSINEKRKRKAQKLYTSINEFKKYNK